MRDPKDSVTGELVPMKRGRGRPRKSDAMTPAERQRAYRERNGLVPLTVELPAEVVAGFKEYLAFKDVSQSEVIARLIKSQLLRKR